MDPTNWRPITLTNTIYKVYSGILAGRLSAIPNLISPEQKGFCRTDGTGEHIAVLRNAIHEPKNNGLELATAGLDLTNASTFLRMRFRRLCLSGTSRSLSSGSVRSGLSFAL